jgi:hypothetical protein
VLTALPGGRCIYTVVPDFASRDTADARLSSEDRPRLVAEAGLHAAGQPPTWHLSGLEAAWPRPGAGADPARQQADRACVRGRILPLLEAVGYLPGPRRKCSSLPTMRFPRTGLFAADRGTERSVTHGRQPTRHRLTDAYRTAAMRVRAPRRS